MEYNLGIKRKIKNIAKTCFCCGKTFDSYNDKNCHRVNHDKGFLAHNTVVICTECRNKLISTKEHIYQMDIKQEVLDKYFLPFDKDYKYDIIKKVKYFKRYTKGG